MAESITDRIYVRGSFQLAGLLSACLGSAYALYSGTQSDSANTRRIDEAIKHADDRITALEQRLTGSDQRLWDELIKQRKEIKDDLRYELEHGK
jgi:uncharacterized protein YdcH (DUF465 family)